MALASGGGIEATPRARGRQSPASRMSKAHTTNAPTASANPPAGTVLAARKAAPGVDQAILIGQRLRNVRMTVSNPIRKPTAIRPEAASAGEAPTPLSPCTTTAKLEAKPASEASRPAKTALAEKASRWLSGRAASVWAAASVAIPSEPTVMWRWVAQ
jgi:hypothetical protein